MKCPDCEAEICAGLKTCPECGYDFEYEKEKQESSDVPEQTMQGGPAGLTERIKGKVLVLLGIGAVVLAIICGIAVYSWNRDSGEQNAGKESGTGFTEVQKNALQGSTAEAKAQTMASVLFLLGLLFYKCKCQAVHGSGAGYIKQPSVKC